MSKPNFPPPITGTQSGTSNEILLIPLIKKFKPLIIRLIGAFKISPITPNTLEKKLPTPLKTDLIELHKVLKNPTVALNADLIPFHAPLNIFPKNDITGLKTALIPFHIPRNTETSTPNTVLIAVNAAPKHFLKKAATGPNTTLILFHIALNTDAATLHAVLIMFHAFMNTFAINVITVPSADIIGGNITPRIFTTVFIIGIRTDDNTDTMFIIIGTIVFMIFIIGGKTV